MTVRGSFCKRKAVKPKKLGKTYNKYGRSKQERKELDEATARLAELCGMKPQK